MYHKVKTTTLVTNTKTCSASFALSLEMDEGREAEKEQNDAALQHSGESSAMKRAITSLVPVTSPPRQRVKSGWRSK
jgi:hypothetical protein